MPKLVRAEYKPPVYFINKVDLVFEIPDLHDAATLVTGTMQYKTTTPGAPLVLHADGADLQSITINGENIDLTTIVTTEDDDSQLLTIANVPAEGTLVIKNCLKPWSDDSCAGLYGDKGTLLTQCEATSFRKIIPYIDRPDNLAIFTCEIQANERELPVLLSNGNLIAAGKLPNGRHFARYEDPFPKPSYLFALVAGNFGCLKDHYFTKSGRKVNLFVHVKSELAGKAVIAMQALKESMQWDEDNYELEYDLDNCHMVGAESFNAGAMENKGLIIFNEQCLLAEPYSSTDKQMLYVWDVVSHEYFHNYAGNRVTVRSWEELALKEGLATRKETDFMMDKFGHAVYRINEVDSLRVDQFSEDAGPTSHAVRPDEVDSIDNIYTETIYTKGAELLAMLSRMLGRKTFTEGVKYYFKKFDGQAVTIEDFIGAQEHVSGRNLQQFLLWYKVPGTPKLAFNGTYDPETQLYVLQVKQSLFLAKGDMHPIMHIPITINLLANDGSDMWSENKILELTKETDIFIFENIAEKPVPSLLRDFSAPVIVTKSPVTSAEELFLFRHDKDPVNRYLVGQKLMRTKILDIMQKIKNEPNLEYDSVSLPQDFIDAIEHVITIHEHDKEFLVSLLTIPSLDEIISDMESVELELLIQAHACFTQKMAQSFDWHKIYNITYTNNNALTAELIGQRSLHNLALQYLMHKDADANLLHCSKQFFSATCMTDIIGALKALMITPAKFDPQQNLDYFYERWSHDSQAMDAWMRIQATSTAPDTVEKLRALMQHKAFNITVPNHVYAVVRYFGAMNIKQFHRKDGEGYKFVIDAVIQIDPVNSGLAARVMLELFNDWQKFDTARQRLMIAQLSRLNAVEGLSSGTKDLVTKKLYQPQEELVAEPVSDKPLVWSRLVHYPVAVNSAEDEDSALFEEDSMALSTAEPAVLLAPEPSLQP